MTSTGRVRPVTRGCFRTAHLQGLLCGGELGRVDAFDQRDDRAAFISGQLLLVEGGSRFNVASPRGACSRCAAKAGMAHG